MKKKYILIGGAAAAIGILFGVNMLFGLFAGHKGYEKEYSGSTNVEGINEWNEVVDYGEQTPIENDVSAEELFMEGLRDSLVEEEYLTPASELSNAILHALQISILEDKGDECKVRITYPEVGEELVKLEKELPEDANEEEIYALYKALTEMVNAENITMKEVTCTLGMGIDEYGESYIDWTEEAMNAMTGGLYGIQ